MYDIYVICSNIMYIYIVMGESFVTVKYLEK